MKNKKPVIGIAGSLLMDASGRFENYWRAYVNEDYVTAVLKAGGIPFVIPVVADEEVMRGQLENIDAIVFSGGTDIDPKFYGEEMQPLGTKADERRDQFDLKLFALTQELKKPTLCICRGHQVAIVANGGNLYQDLSYMNLSTQKHDDYPHPCSEAHDVMIDKDSLLFDVLGKDRVTTNSFHHQAAKDVPSIFKVTSRSKDDIIESIEYKNPDYFFLSVQWHPEMMATCDCVDMLKLFERLVKEAY